MALSSSTLPLQTFDDLVSNQASAVLAQSTGLIDFQEGSVLRAMIESNAGNSIWIQGLISALLAVARLQTSSGNDVDTFINAFGYFRTQASPSSGSVTFSRTITTGTSSIPASNTIVSATVGKIQVQFTTTVDTTNPAYDPTTNSYLMAPTVSSVTVPVQCLTSGIIGNVLIGAINTINSPLTNVTGVTNSLAFINGVNIASDAQAKAGFVLYLAGLSKATYSAIASVVANSTGVTRYLIVENENESSQTQLGYFYVVIDNGSGTASGLVSNVLNAVNAVRGLAIIANVDAASANPISASPPISARFHVPSTTTTAQKTAITAAAQSSISSFLSTLPIGGTFYYNRLIQLLFDASPIITEVDMVALNGGSSDFPSSALQVPTVVASNISISYISP